MEFNSRFNVRNGLFNHDWPVDIVKNEPMFFNCDIDFAWKHGGPITCDFINGLPQDWLDANPVIDSRVHMLMPNWWPCIPGWHHDDVPRSTPTGQPNYENPEYRAEHLMGLVNGHLAPTKFINDLVVVSDPDFNTKQYNVWSKEIFEQPNLVRVDCPSGKYVQFDSSTFHTGVRATGNGWRWFIRLSRNTDRQKTITNEIRRQVQVYMDDPFMGW